MKRIIGGGLVLALFFAFSSILFAQDAGQMKENKAQKMDVSKGEKKEMTKGEKEMGPLKTVACDDKCGFMVRGRNEKELISIVKAHVKKMHKMDITDKQVKEMMKTADEPAGAKP